jgi:hypothetical protein
MSDDFIGPIPPLDPDLMSGWCIGVCWGEAIGRMLIEEDPEMASAVEELGEETVIQFFECMMSQIMQRACDNEWLDEICEDENEFSFFPH